jgi:hypothetical protein
MLAGPLLFLLVGLIVASVIIGLAMAMLLRDLRNRRCRAASRSRGRTATTPRRHAARRLAGVDSRRAPPRGGGPRFDGRESWDIGP